MKVMNIESIIHFLCNHEHAGDDFCDFFDVDIWEESAKTLNDRLEPNKVVNWLLDHQLLARDALIYLSDLSEEEVMAMTPEQLEEAYAEGFSIII